MNKNKIAFLIVVAIVVIIGGFILFSPHPTVTVFIICFILAVISKLLR